MRYIIVPHMEQVLPAYTVDSRTFNLRDIWPYCILHTTRLVPRECGPLCHNTHSSSSVPSPYHVIVYHVESLIYPHTPSSLRPTLLSRITFYVVIFGPFVCLDQRRVVAWRMDCFWYPSDADDM